MLGTYQWHMSVTNGHGFAPCEVSTGTVPVVTVQADAGVTVPVTADAL